MDFLKESTIFNPSSGLSTGKKSNLVSTVFSRPVPYYVLPETMGNKERGYFLFYIAALATSEDNSLESWKSWVATYVCAVTPALSKILSRKVFEARMVPSTHILMVTELFEKVEDAIKKGDADLIGRLTGTLAVIKPMEGLPSMKTGLTLADANGEWNYKVIMCHFSIMLFLAGKRVAGNDHSQITVARPRALKSKAHLDMLVSLLEGSFKMSDKAHVKINDAWSEMGILRSVVFTEYAKFESAESDESQNLIWTTMHLLRFSGMSHASIVHNFLQVCPWVHEIPTLRPALACYARSVVTASRVDEKLFPYLKLIQGDKTTFFQRKDLEPLIACAVSVLVETTPTLSAYYTRTEFSSIVDAFTVLREEKERKTGSAVVLEVPKPKFEGEVSEDPEDEGM